MYMCTLQYISTMYLYTLGCSSTVYYMNTLQYISTIYTLDCSSAMFEYKLGCSTMYVYTLQYSYNTYVLTLGVRVFNGVLPHPIRVYELS